MDKQFTASEVRDYLFSIEERSSRQWLIAHDTDLGMLRQFADLLEAQEKAVPVYQHRSKNGPRIQWFDCSEETFTAMEHNKHDREHFNRRILYTHPASSNAERLAEALRNLVEASHYADAPDEHEAAEAALAAHSAQAQPPAARVMDAMVERALYARVPGGAQVWHWLPDECGRHPHPTAYAIMRAALEAALAAQENPNG